MQAICMRILAVGLLIASTELGFAQMTLISPTPTATWVAPQPLAANEIALTNELGQEVKVHIRPVGGEWTTHVVPRSSTLKVWCQRCRDVFEITMESGGKLLKQLKTGNRYFLRR